jgi:indole-3-glycerol phosphate synthase/phosphoribosylanthranilate isomerase
VGVVVLEEGSQKLDSETHNLMSEGLLDAVQFHGQEHPEACFSMAFPYYKALRLGSIEDVDMIRHFNCPRVLVDAYAPGMAGGTGRQIQDDLIEAVRNRHPLWLAGGIGPDNVSDIIDSFVPELIDTSSALESEPGVKDKARMRRFFNAIHGG